MPSPAGCWPPFAINRQKSQTGPGHDLLHWINGDHLDLMLGLNGRLGDVDSFIRQPGQQVFWRDCTVVADADQVNAPFLAEFVLQLIAGLQVFKPLESRLALAMEVRRVFVVLFTIIRVVIAKAFYPRLLHVTMQLRSYLHPRGVPGARGWFIALAGAPPDRRTFYLLLCYFGSLAQCCPNEVFHLVDVGFQHIGVDTN